MSKIFDSLKSLVSQEMISKASSLVEEKDSNVSSVVSAIIPSLLAVLLKNGNNPQLKNILEEAGNLNILSGIKDIFSEEPSQQQQKIGDDFLQHLLGDKAADFTAPIAAGSGVSKVAVNRLISMLAPVVSGFLGNKMLKENLNFHNLLSELKTEFGSFSSLIPSGLTSSFGLSSIHSPEKPDPVKLEKAPEKKKSNWLVWIILLAVVLLAIVLFWRYCNKTPAEVVNTTVAVTDTLKNKAAQVVEAIKEKVSTEVILPSGLKLNVFKGGIEDQMVTFLKSDEYKNANEEQLKNKWFNFDNIEFKHGSGNELTDKSFGQLNNIIEILKQFKGAKVKVGGYTDKTGNSEANQKISQERANTVKSVLVEGGVPANSISAEGYGDQFAKYGADAPDSLRAHDRIIALRFVK